MMDQASNYRMAFNKLLNDTRNGNKSINTAIEQATFINEDASRNNIQFVANVNELHSILIETIGELMPGDVDEPYDDINEDEYEQVFIADLGKFSIYGFILAGTRSDSFFITYNNEESHRFDTTDLARIAGPEGMYDIATAFINGAKSSYKHLSTFAWIVMKSTSDDYAINRAYINGDIFDNPDNIFEDLSMVLNLQSVADIINYFINAIPHLVALYPVEFIEVFQ